VPDGLLVTFDGKQAASDHITRAIGAIQAPQNGSTFGPTSGELIALTEANRKLAVRHLLAAIVQLIPDNHPDVPLRAMAETWIRS